MARKLERTHLPDQEKLVDMYLRERCKREGVKYIKLGTQFHSGLPDRMLMFKGGRTKFVELKGVEGVPTPLQKNILKEFSELGFETYILYGGSPIECLIDVLL